ncbi:MAG: PhoH family protein, partial [Elusimicrobia bacterium]|nr:PhoH family protein [Elusimicrobiota bacterium]
MKTFVLDTNVLIHDPDSIFDFDDNEVVIPLTVIEELDNLKRSSAERGRNARLVSRKIDALRERGRLDKGMSLDSGGSLRIETEIKSDNMPAYLKKRADNEILSVALGLKENGSRVIFISKDINMRIKAEALGLEVQDFDKARVKFEELYAGWREIEIEDHLVDEFQEQKVMPAPEGLIPQEFLLIKSSTDEKKRALGRYFSEEGVIKSTFYDKAKPRGLTALNMEQKFAIEALMNEDIKLVTLVGLAGTGKTLLALACGLHMVFDESKYRKLLISRPVIRL